MPDHALPDHAMPEHDSAAHGSPDRLDQLLAAASIAPEVAAEWPSYTVLLIAATGLRPAPADPTSEALLAAAEESARDLPPLAELPEVAAWREAYRAFGAKPKKYRCSVEALLRRAPAGLPRINALTDTYNAISVSHRIPIGGEDLTTYTGPARLVRATGDEPFDTTRDGQPVTEHPDPGEVVWADDGGVTCRRWNWRQCRRTQLTDATTEALFILDGLAPVDATRLTAAGDELAAHLRRMGPDVQLAQRLLAAAPDEGRS